MRLSILITIILLINSSLFAQKIGLRAGFNLSSAFLESDIGKIDTKFLSGFNFGLSLEKSFSSELHIFTSLIYTTKGFKAKNDMFHDRINYILLPVNIKYKFESQDNISPYIEIGPYIGLGLSANMNVGQTPIEVEFGEELKRFDGGINLGGGIEISKFNLGLYYEFGLINIINTDNNKYKLRNLSFNIGYILN